MTVGGPSKADANGASQGGFQSELPMPKDSHLLCPMSQALLQAARAGRVNKASPSVGEEDAKGGGGGGGGGGEDDDPAVAAGAGGQGKDEGEKETFAAMRWQLVPRHLEGPEVEYLAKRRKGLDRSSRTAGNALVRSVMKRVTIKRTDTEGNSVIEEMLMAEGQTVDGEIISEVIVTEATGGTVVEGVAMVSADRLVVTGDSAQPTPNRRRPPPPRRKPKGPGRGRKKKVQFVSTGKEVVVQTVAGGAVNSGEGFTSVETVSKVEEVIEVTITKERGITSTGKAENGDVEMGEGEADNSNLPEADEGEGDDDEEEGEEGEEGEGDDDDGDDDREEGELSPSPEDDRYESMSPTKAVPLAHSQPPSAPSVLLSQPTIQVHPPSQQTQQRPPPQSAVYVPPPAAPLTINPTGLRHPLPPKPGSATLPPQSPTRVSSTFTPRFPPPQLPVQAVPIYGGDGQRKVEDNNGASSSAQESDQRPLKASLLDQEDTEMRDEPDDAVSKEIEQGLVPLWAVKETESVVAGPSTESIPSVLPASASSDQEPQIRLASQLEPEQIEPVPTSSSLSSSDPQALPDPVLISPPPSAPFLPPPDEPSHQVIQTSQGDSVSILPPASLPPPPPTSDGNESTESASAVPSSLPITSASDSAVISATAEATVAKEVIIDVVEQEEIESRQGEDQKNAEMQAEQRDDEEEGQVKEDLEKDEGEVLDARIEDRTIAGDGGGGDDERGDLRPNNDTNTALDNSYDDHSAGAADNGHRDEEEEGQEEFGEDGNTANKSSTTDTSNLPIEVMDSTESANPIEPVASIKPNDDDIYIAKEAKQEETQEREREGIDGDVEMTG